MSTSNDFDIDFSVERVLVVGSWAKEQITIENIKRNKKIEVFAYMDTKNPAIVSMVDSYKIGKLDAVDEIVTYADKKNIDLVIITTAEPLSNGAVDALEKKQINVFGPIKKAAKLESDKAFTRELLKKHSVDAIPDFQVCKNEKDAIKYARSLNWEVAVKPIGLTEGLGVKVFGDQLQTKEELKDYIKKIFREGIGGHKKVLIEEKLLGEEFTIQCLVNKNKIISTPAVQDFKKLFSGGKGPNTASMGSYSTSKKILPFMKKTDYDKALNVIKKTIEAFYSETGETCRGFLYGQFIITKKGIKLLEYNFRPGDPEWMNTLYILEDNIIDVILNLLKNKEKNPRFEDKATVCKYIVPPNYPQKLYQTLDVNFDENKIRQQDVSIYYSCGLDSKGKINVGSERGIAFIAKDETIEKANKKIEQAISLVKGDFHYRRDIGTQKLIQNVVSHVNRLRT